MGGLFSLASGFFAPKQHVRILMVGLDSAGKTTILYKLRLGKVETTIPTIGFNVENLEYKKGRSSIVSFTAWDVGGRDKIRPLLRHYYQQTNALVFVVDSNDRERLDDAREQLQRMLPEDELMDVPLLVFANKQDLPHAMKPSELAEHLGLTKIRNRRWFIQESCATTGCGLYEGLDWLSHEFNCCTSKPTQSPAQKELLGRAMKPSGSITEHQDDSSTADTEDMAARHEVIEST